MRRPLTLLAFLLVALSTAFFGAGAGSSSAEVPVQGSLAAQLRYVGRDTTTGMPAVVDDRFIAQAAEDIARYGQDAREPVPPPPVEGLDIASVTVPRLGISAAPVKRFGLDAYGRLDVPQDSTTIGWNPAYSDLPGTGGSTFLAAHFEYAGSPGIFNQLTTMQTGDEITVSLSDGSAYHYRVTSDIDYALATIDMGALLRGREGIESITLMTCSGPPGADGYPLRTVVLAERVP